MGMGGHRHVPTALIIQKEPEWAPDLHVSEDKKSCCP